jgi:hypothetical protein
MVRVERMQHVGKTFDQMKAYKKELLHKMENTHLDKLLALQKLEDIQLENYYLEMELEKLKMLEKNKK